MTTHEPRYRGCIVQNPVPERRVVIRPILSLMLARRGTRV